MLSLKSKPIFEKKKLINKQRYSLLFQPKYLKGSWVECTNCLKWRYLKNTVDPNSVPEIWICEMNEDKQFNSCDIDEDPGN